MKIILLCSSQSNHVALANKVAAKYGLAGIVVEQKKASQKKLSFKKILKGLTDRIIFNKITSAWASMQKHYADVYPQLPAFDIHHTVSINGDDVKEYIGRLRPDLIMVSGTSLLKKNILEIPLPVGIINLHTGLSPYVKGGPNCTNWCISNGDFHLIGNTSMWIDAGIDSGDIVTTGTVPFTGQEDLAAIHFKVMEHAHELYLGTLAKIISGTAARVKQSSVAPGKTYYTRDWNFEAKWKLLRNMRRFRKHVNSQQYKQLQEALVLVK